MGNDGVKLGWMAAEKSKATVGRAEFSPAAKAVVVPLFLLAMVNFFAFFVIALALGGDGLNGYAKDGHYFLASHGKYTEVTGSVWTYSRVHAVSVFVTHGLLMVVAIIFLARGEIKVRK